MRRDRNFVIRLGAAVSLGSVKKASGEKAKRVCKKHVWVNSKFSRECTRCGVFEEKDINGNFLPGK